MKIYLASGNYHKKQEFLSILKNYEIVLPKEENIDFAPEETGLTFLDNALIKAKALYELVKKPVIADDSGLCIDVLNGAPGIFSARYGDTENKILSFDEKIKKILHELKTAKNRNAHFVCCIAAVWAPDRFYCIQEACYGEIANTPSGLNGFGYDPIFYIQKLGKTFAELTEGEKNSISHRGKALNSILALLKNITF